MVQSLLLLLHNLMQWHRLFYCHAMAKVIYCHCIILCYNTKYFIVTMHWHKHFFHRCVISIWNGTKYLIVKALPYAMTQSILLPLWNPFYGMVQTIALSLSNGPNYLFSLCYLNMQWHKTFYCHCLTLCNDTTVLRVRNLKQLHKIFYWHILILCNDTNILLWLRNLMQWHKLFYCICVI